jgi:hypothetical protein
MTLHAALVLLLTCLGPDPSVCPQAAEQVHQQPKLAALLAEMSDLEGRK